MSFIDDSEGRRGWKKEGESVYRRMTHNAMEEDSYMSMEEESSRSSLYMLELI